VNATDPLGLCTVKGEGQLYPGACATTGAEAIAAEKEIQASSGGGGFSFSAGLDALGGAADDVGSGVASGAKWVAAHPAETVGIVAGAVAASTGVGALADLTILGLDGTSLAVVSSGAGLVASGADVPGCVSGSTASCIGIGANLLGSGLGVGGLLADGSDILQGVLSSKAFSIGIAATFWDLFASGTAGARTCRTSP
jgi:hypothetical protein